MNSFKFKYYNYIYTPKNVKYHFVFNGSKCQNLSFASISKVLFHSRWCHWLDSGFKTKWGDESRWKDVCKGETHWWWVTKAQEEFVIEINPRYRWWFANNCVFLYIFEWCQDRKDERWS